MFKFETRIRVRYGETDQMGYVYYGNYALYYEVGRVEALRSLGVSYRSLEEQGIMLPVLEMESKYIKPARYDDNLLVNVLIKEPPVLRIKFDFEVYNEQRDLLNIASVTLVFIDMKTGRPTRCPRDLADKINAQILRK